MADETPTPPPRTRTGEIIGKGTEAVKTVAGLTTTEAMTLTLVFLILVVSSGMGYLLWSKDKMQSTIAETALRSGEVREELRDQRYAAREDKVLAVVTKMNETNAAGWQMMATNFLEMGRSFGKMEAAILRVIPMLAKNGNGNGHEEEPIVAAPMPKVKGGP
jgi:uncharacterized ion transporter superfamily protein YfcC